MAIVATSNYYECINNQTKLAKKATHLCSNVLPTSVNCHSAYNDAAEEKAIAAASLVVRDFASLDVQTSSEEKSSGDSKILYERIVMKECASLC